MILNTKKIPVYLLAVTLSGISFSQSTLAADCATALKPIFDVNRANNTYLFSTVTRHAARDIKNSNIVGYVSYSNAGMTFYPNHLWSTAGISKLPVDTLSATDDILSADNNFKSKGTKRVLSVNALGWVKVKDGGSPTLTFTGNCSTGVNPGQVLLYYVNKNDSWVITFTQDGPFPK